MKIKKAITTLLFTLFSVSSIYAQIFYPDLSDHQKKALSGIEKLYLSSLTDATYADEIDYGMMALVGFSKNQKDELFRLPIADIAGIEVMAMKDRPNNFEIVFQHRGGWEHNGFQNINNKAQAENLKKHLSLFINEIDLYNNENIKNYCDIFRGYRDVLLPKKYEDSYGYYTKIEIVLLGLSGSNIRIDRKREIGFKINWLMAKHSDLIQYDRHKWDNISLFGGYDAFPKGNLFNNLVRHFGYDLRRMLNFFRFNPNIVMQSKTGKPWDDTILDMTNFQLGLSAYEDLKETKEQLISLGAKSSANDKNNWEENPLLISFMGDFGKYGFKRPDGSIAIDAQFEDVGHFSEGLVSVRKDREWGFIDKTGKLIIPYQYNAAYDFYEGLAIVRKFNPSDRSYKEGYIDVTGKELAIEYDEVFKFKDGIARVKNNDLAGYIDRTGNTIVVPQYIYAEDFEGGIARVKNSNDEIFYIDKNGANISSGLQFFPVSEYSEGLINAQDKSTQKWGFVNKHGEQVIPFQYDFASPFSDGLAAVVKDDRMGFIDGYGKLIINHQFGSLGVEKFMNGYVTLTKNPEDGKKTINYNSGIIDKKGTVIIPFIYEGETTAGPGVKEMHENRVAVRKNLKDNWGYFDEKGKQVIPSIYEVAEDFNNGMARVKISDMNWTYIDKQGKELFPRFTYIDAFNEDGYARVIEKSGKIYYMDRQGNKLDKD